MSLQLSIFSFFENMANTTNSSRQQTCLKNMGAATFEWSLNAYGLEACVDVGASEEQVDADVDLSDRQYGVEDGSTRLVVGYH